MSLLGSRSSFSARETPFSRAPVMDTPCCLVLDVRLPGMSGLKLQEELTKAEVHVPIIFLTAHGDIPMAVGAMKAGAVDFLTKPFRNQDVTRCRLCRSGARWDAPQKGTIEFNHTRALRVAQPARAGRGDAGCGRRAQQADRRRTGLERGDREGPSRQSHAQDARKVVAELVRMTDNAQHE